MTMETLAAHKPPARRVRARAPHHKTRSGCVTCKRRRIKCGEERPACSRCRQSSLSCEGYQPPKAWIFEIPTKQAATSESEQQLLTFSYERGIEYMTLYAKSTHDFFKMYAPQMAHLHPAAKHALLGLSAQYQASLDHMNPKRPPDVASKHRTDALLHYGKGMKELARISPKSMPLEVLISCSLLFTAIELWPQKNMAPHVHILHGLRMAQSVPSTTIHSDTLAGYLLRILLFLAENVASYNDNFTESSLGITDAYIDEPWRIPSVFDDPAEAVEQVDKLVKRAARLDHMSMGDNQGRRKRLWEVHGCLSEAIENTIHQKPKEKVTCHDLRALQVHLRVACVMLRTNMVKDEMIFDSCLEDFTYILSESEKLLAYELEPRSERGPTSVRSSLGLLPPLFLVTTKCRDSILRHRAVKLLHASKRRERLWNSCVAYMLAHTVISVEEECSDRYDTLRHCLPPNNQRVCLSEVNFDREGGCMTVQYTRSPGDAPTTYQKTFRRWIPAIDDNYEVVSLSKKSLRAYGYTGTILVSPRICCQCGNDLARQNGTLMY